MWLILEEVERRIRAAEKAGLTPTAEQSQIFAGAVVEARDGSAPRNLKIAGNIAEIRVEGVLTRKPNFLAWLFGGGNTTYESIIASLSLAANDPGVKKAVLHVDSPGGEVAGLFDALAAIQAFPKPLSVTASCACSAAYAIAAVGGRITATNHAAHFGSVGVLVQMLVSDDVVTVTSTEAPKKAPDPRTEEGKAAIREGLDAMHQLFVDAIAHGRETTVANVNDTYGRGASLLAGEAKRLGMIDAIATPALRAVGGAKAVRVPDEGAPETMEDDEMDLNEFKTKHPHLYSSIVEEARAAGHEAGVTAERKRVNTHLKLGDKFGAMETAVGFIRDGAELDAEVTAEYLCAHATRQEQDAHQSESDAAAEIVEGSTAAAAPEADMETQVHNEVLALMGRTVGGTNG